VLVRLGVEAAIIEGALLPGDVDVVEGRLAAVGLGGDRGRGIAVPGFVDLQVNGYAGVDFASADAAAYRRAGEALLETGVTAFQPTFITASEEALVESLREVPRTPVGPRLLGIHVEGPFISPERLGVHPGSARRDPDRGMVERLLAAGPVAQVTLAPELDGALDIIDLLQERGVIVSCGHSQATAAEAALAFDRGVGTVTHLFNAMRPIGHRDPGIAGLALARDDVVVQLIVDGQHLADEIVRIVWRAAAGRVALVTDVIAAAGMGDGRYRLGSIEVEVRNGVARGLDGMLGGSTVTMLESVRNLQAIGAPFMEAIAAATSVPARAARQPLGVLRLGGHADIVVLDDGLQIRTVLVDGSERVAA
jgi:N-acetylglucosamine-6-phosphate deacetylase